MTDFSIPLTKLVDGKLQSYQHSIKLAFSEETSLKDSFGANALTLSQPEGTLLDKVAKYQPLTKKTKKQAKCLSSFVSVRTSLKPPERVFKQGCGYKQRYKHSQGQPVKARLERKSVKSGQNVYSTCKKYTGKPMSFNR